ncbi:hypothetical protein SK128_004865 [Halocaridina rubra]|uniref:S1 motif domain-containing protein n=1 Tax=Halocaridina rubra TaxID=373956 RepID=A0AAN9AHC4_HALRR
MILERDTLEWNLSGIQKVLPTVMAERKHRDRDLFTVNKRKNKKLLDKHKKKKVESDDDDWFDDPVKKEKDSSKVLLEPLSYAGLTEGLVTLGCICKITQYYMLVSLPYKLYGKVSITHVSQAYTALLKEITKKENKDDPDVEVLPLDSLFKVGQHVVTQVESVTKVKQNFQVSLSLIPKAVNFGLSAPKLKEGIILPCAVASIEDNGYVMETGITSVRAAFLNRAKSKGLGALGVGSILRCVISQAQHSENMESVQLKLSALPKDVNDAPLEVVNTDDFSILIPGTAIKTTISRVGHRCLKLMLAEYDGVVGPKHLRTPVNVLSNYRVGQDVVARVLYITPLSRTVHLTLQNDIFVIKSEEELFQGLKIGDIMQGTVMDSEPGGVNFKIGKGCKGYCPSRRLKDSANDKLNIRADFPTGSQHELRILSYNRFEQTFIVSLQKSVLEEETLDMNSLSAGQILMVTIKKYKKNRALARVAKKVLGIIPFYHLTEAQFDHPEKKYPKGSTVKTRVLEVFPKRKRLILTCKKSLVNSVNPVVANYNKNLQNQVVDGFVGHVYPVGLLVVFYNNIKGFVPKRFTWVGKSDELGNHFKVGDVVKTKVVSVDPEEKKITLSLMVDAEESKDDEKHCSTKPVVKSNKSFSVRDTVRCVIKGIEADCLKVRLKPGNIRAEIPNFHLADDPRRCLAIKKILRVGDEVTNAVVFELASKITLSLKESISCWIHRTKKLVMEQFKESKSYPAVISEIMETEATVSIPVGRSGQNADVSITSEFVNELVVGGCIDVKCEGFLDDEKSEPILSICSQYSKKKKTRMRLQEIYSHLQYQKLLQVSKARKGFVNKEFTDLEIGQKLDVEVISVLTLGLLVKSASGAIPGIILNEHCPPDVEYEVGEILNTCILHVNAIEKCVILTARNDLVDELHTNEDPKLSIGQKVRCEVVFVEKKFIIVQLKSHSKGKMVYVPYDKKAAKLKNCTITIKFMEGSYVFGITKSQEKWGLLPVKSKIPLIHLSIFETVREKHRAIDDFERYSLTKLKKIAFLSHKKKNEDEDLEKPSTKVNGEILVNKYSKKKTVREITLKKKKNKVIKNTDKANQEHLQSTVDMEKNKKRKVSIGSEKNSNSPMKGKVKSGSGEKSGKRKNESKENESLSLKKKKKSDIINGNIRENLKGDESTDSGVDEVMNIDDDGHDLIEYSKPCLKIGNGFVWDVPEDKDVQELESSSDEEDQEDNTKKKSKKLTRIERNMLAKEEEKRLHDLECARLHKDRLPQSAMDYEELLQQSPNSSALWIQFISFYLENAELEQARSVAKRALQLINMQEYEERINVWTVLLRLEVLYGTEESTEEAFKEALATNDPLKIYLAMAMVFAESNKVKEAEDTYFKLTKKFNQVFDVWIKAGIFFYKAGKLEEARRYMERALLSLDKAEHVNLINRFSQLEFQFGDIERARTMFESLLSNYPKRMDIWSVYVDLLAKKGEVAGARQVLERMTNLKLRLKNMRFVFMKFVQFEKQHGTPQSVETIKNRVQDYIASCLQQE